MSSDDYLVWSNEHQGWWKPGGYGYAPGLRHAGHFTREQAIQICRDAVPQSAHIGMIAEIPVRLDDISEVLRDQMIPRAIYGEK